MLALVLTGCRVDVAVDVTMAQNGSGEVRVTVEVDAEVAERAPGLAGDVRLADLRAAGWTTDGVRSTADGGMVLVLVHRFDTPEQATALLATLNGPSGPLQAVALARDGTRSAITYRVTGSVRLDDGLDALADAQLLTTLGASPWADVITQAGLTPDEAVGITLRATLPGASTGDATADEVVDGDGTTVFRWAVPLDGGRSPVEATSRLSLERGGAWGPLAWVLRALLVVWLVVAIGFTLTVARARARRRRFGSFP